MTIEDVPDVTEIENTVFADPWTPESFLAEIERKPDVGFPVVVHDRGGVCAYAVVWFIVDELHIGNIAVRPDAQGRGIGRALLTALLGEARRRGMVKATLEVRPSNSRARALYEGYGFRPVAIRRAYYRDNREDALVMETDLDDDAAGRRWSR
jgi:ribosomal-protein-alanine N-acetyltransferase